MSYGFEMNFIQCKSKAQALDKVYEISELYYTYIEQVLEDNKYFIPSCKYNITSDKERSLINEYWIKGSLSLRFVYWKKYKLLGILGNFNKYDKIKEMFDVSVYFQNSTDQNYDYEEWGDGINVFNEIIENVKNYTVDELKGIYKYRFNDEDEEDISEKDINYYSKTAVYDLIYNALELNDWLYNHENSKFINIDINPINSQERVFSTKVKLHKLLIKLGEITEDNYYI